MGFWGKIGGFFKGVARTFASAFVAFVKSDPVKNLLRTQLGAFALSAVTQLATSGLSNDEKRRAAFDAIKAEAVARGEFIKDSAINLLVELAVQKIKDVGGQE